MSATTARRPREALSAASFAISSAAVAVETACAFLPWVRTGTRERSSFEAVGAARQLGILRSPAERIVGVAWYLVPLLVALAALAIALRARRMAALAMIIAGVLGAAVGTAVLRSPLAHRTSVVVATLSAAFAVFGGITFICSSSTTTGRQ